MPVAQKAALEQGRDEARAVRHYLDAVAAARQGRPSAATIRQRLTALDRRLASPARFNRLSLLEKQRELRLQLRHCKEPADMAALEAAFVKVARSYSRRKGISYVTWRAVGVKPAVLAKAGIHRTRA